MSDLLAIGASGVRTYQGALTTTSENIANAGVEGYARRSATIAEVGAASGTYSSSTLNGLGSRIAGTARSADGLRSAAVRTASADLARTESGSAWLDRIQTALTGNQVSGRVTSFFASATTLAADPTSSAARTAMLESGTTVAGAFQSTGRALDQVAADLDSTADQATAALNGFGRALARVNDGLARTPAGSAASASLADQRDRLLEQMAAIVDVTVAADSLGRATVKLGDAGGPVFVSGGDAGAVTYARSAGAVSFALFRDGQVSAVSPNGGALGGVVDGANRVAEARGTLNGIARDFGDAVNAFQAAGQTLTGTAPGADMFAIDDDVPTEMSLALTNPDDIAAASVGGGTRDGSNLATLAAARASSKVEGRTTTLVATNAAALEQRRLVADAQSAIRDGAVSARDAVSGVNLDAEAVDLLRFQQAYQASSKVIQVARDIFQSIIGIN